jgi:hypothetical protein
VADFLLGYQQLAVTNGVRVATAATRSPLSSFTTISRYAGT